MVIGGGPGDGAAIPKLRFVSVVNMFWEPFDVGPIALYGEGLILAGERCYCNS